MFESVRTALGRRARRATRHECRNCGTAVGEEDATCPACGSTEVATYEL